MPHSVSIVVPTCERLESVLRLLTELRENGVLGRSDIEAIIVDNNLISDAELRAQVERLGCHYVHEAQRGQAAALNTGIRCARGEIVVFLDDDVRIVSGKWLDHLVYHFSDPAIAYVAGNVVAAELATPSQRAWEAKGGLSKGSQSRRFGPAFFRRARWGGVPLRFIACGANSAVRKSVLNEVGLFDERFGVGSAIGHSQSHELCYKIMRAGYVAFYDNQAVVGHCHPRTWAELRRKMFHYGIGDTAVQLHFFLTYGDLGGLREALFARHLYLLGNVVKRIVRSYPLPISMILAGLAGATVGPLVYLTRARLNLKTDSQTLPEPTRSLPN